MTMDTSRFSVGPLMRMNADAFFGLMEQAHQISNKFSYLELGCLGGKTVLGACQFLSEHKKPWKAFGVDLNGGPWFAKKPPGHQLENLRKNIGQFLTFINDGSQAVYSHDKDCGVYLTGTERFLRNTPERFDFVFLDACHEAPCCTRDFILVEPLVKLGGILAVHDTNPDIQGGDNQQHTGRPLEVRAMLDCMGLLNGTRQGWKLLYDLVHPINTDRGCVFLKKTE